MKEEIILKIENLSKQYRLGTIGTGTISHDLNRWFAKIRGKQDPYLKIGEVNDRASKSNSQYVWALKDINFEVNRGEVLGIIGKNGAGKSTLLKILSKVTGPTIGSIKSKGKIASLLEVGTGFHPEMTGKENVFLNGAILGMTKKEIASKLDEIISFSGCERYIDTPVKRYSSGMKVRLAFAIAAHLEPDVLVVDEVLAVGDAEFQKKAIGKMQDISNQSGRTVLFVSHDMGAIKNLCTRLLVLEKGQVSFNGDVSEGINKYVANQEKELNEEIDINSFSNTKLKLNKLEVIYDKGVSSVMKVCDKFKFVGEIEYKNEVLPADLKIELFILDIFGQRQTAISSWLNGVHHSPKNNKITFEVVLDHGLSLCPNKYIVDMLLYDSEITYFESVLSFELVKNPEIGYGVGFKPSLHGKVFTPNKWIINS